MKDATLGGYWREHQRPPAFEGRDGDSYTVEIITERDQSDDEAVWCAYIFFLQWSGNQPVGHVESEYLTTAATAEAARAEVEQLSLHAVKEILDRLLAG